MRLLLSSLVSLAGIELSSAEVLHRDVLVQAVLNEDSQVQAEYLKKLIGANDPLVEQALTAWRGGGVYLYEAEGEQIKVPFLLESQVDGEGRARGIKLADGQVLKDKQGQPLLFLSSDLTPAEADSKLRRAIKTTLDLFSLANPNPKVRRDAVTKLGQDQKPDYIPYFESRLTQETVPDVRTSLTEAIAITQLIVESSQVRIAAVDQLARMRSINALSYLQNLKKEALAAPGKFGQETVKSVTTAIGVIEAYMGWGNLFGTAFRGLSLSAVLLVVALGLAITFGLMGVINMAHGEIMMVGAYTAYLVQNIFQRWFGPSGFGFDMYFIAALVVAFFSAALAGLILERSVIRFLYSRPLESLLATWGVSLFLQQIFRDAFGAANVQVSSPSWLSGSLVLNDVLFAYNRMFVIAFAVFIVLGTYYLMTKTSIGLQVRAVMQNRNMAACMGVRTNRINMLTFAFGSGLAGVAGACLSQIGNVGPSLGQNYIVDCFMIVVLGGVGNLVGTVCASLGIGVTDQILQPWLGAVMGKITVLAAIILFLQWRPAGLFVARSRSLDG